MRTHVPVPCTICGDVTAKYARGRCWRCYQWWRNHGQTVDRPSSVDDRGTPRPCRACDKVTKHVTRGLCRPCYQWAWRHGFQRGVIERRAYPARIGPAALARPTAPAVLLLGRRCDACRRALEPSAPDYQTLCRGCSRAVWWREVAQ